MAPASVTWRALGVVVLGGFLWAHALGLTQFVDPTNIDWMVGAGDWSAHLFGWLFVRVAPWSIPLGQAPDLLAPFGSSAAMTDAIPVLSTVAKLLSPLFGERFQLFGLWMVGGVISTGVAGVLVCRAWFRDVWSLSFAGLLFVMNPIVSTRSGHPSFLAFGVLTALVGVCFWPVSDVRGARRIGAATLALGFFACGVHGYLAVMASALALASVVRLSLVVRVFGRAESAAWVLSAPVVCVLSMWLFGYFGGLGSKSTNLTAEGFGEFSADLVAFVNPYQWSRFLPQLRTGPRQYEGYAYLGLGTLALLVWRLVSSLRARPTRRAMLECLPVLVVCLALAFYALSNRVTLLGMPILDLTAFYEHLQPWPSVFRASGRFVFPLFALLTMVAVLSVTTLRAAYRPWALGAAALLQLVDFDPTQSRFSKQPPFAPLADPAWQLMREGYQHIVIQPIQLQWLCPFDAPLVAKLSWEAYRQHLTINSGHVGRPPPGYSCTRHLTRGELTPDTVYVPYFREHLLDFLEAGFLCARLEGVPVCVSPDNDTAFARELRRRRGP